MKLVIKGGRVIDPQSQIDAIMDVFVAAGKIVGMGAVPVGFHANREINAKDLVVCPGLVDLSARLRERGFEYTATL
jgi:dihydroorotase